MAIKSKRSRAREETAPEPEVQFTGSGLGDFANRMLSPETSGVQDAVEPTSEAAAAAAVVEEKGETRKQRKARLNGVSGVLLDYPHLMEIKPLERLAFRSDYQLVDEGVMCVLSLFRSDAAQDSYPPFWGVFLVPVGLRQDVTVVVLEQVKKQTEKWVENATKNSEKVANVQAGTLEDGGLSSQERRKMHKAARELLTINSELQDGGAYLHVQYRLIVKAPTLEALDEAIDKISEVYINNLGSMKVAPYQGQQREEVASLLSPNKDKLGKGFFLTSQEIAGSYSLVTNGLNDPAGEYVGFMVGDVNTSAVLLDTNGYKHHVVVADEDFHDGLGRSHMPDLWGSKLSQAALLAGQRVVHLVMGPADLMRLGPPLKNLTSRVDLQRGDVNMFELFGQEKDELSIFPTHLEKLVLMAELLQPTTDANRSTTIGALREILVDYYVDQRMWQRNAAGSREKLRLVGLAHEEYPLLRLFVAYLNQRYTSLTNRTAKDNDLYGAVRGLHFLFKNLLETNGDLFGVPTADSIDGATVSRRVIYEFNALLQRGDGLAMAQLVNVVGLAVGSLGKGDVVIIHGADALMPEVKGYLTRQFDRLYQRGARVVLLYNKIDSMLKDQEFNQFDKADFTILGTMRETTVTDYQSRLAKEIPPDLERLITTGDQGYSYLRRGHTNVVFQTDLSLGANPRRQAQRTAAEQQAERLRLTREKTATSTTPTGGQ